MVVVPSQWGADGFPDFSHVVAQDVQVLHEGLEMLFPVACLFSGIESLGGLPELLTRAAEVNRTFSGELKAGSRYATGHPVDPESASWVTRHCVGWFRDWIYSAFKKDPSSGTNPRLYRLLSEISDRRRNFANSDSGVWTIGWRPVGSTARRVFQRPGCSGTHTGFRQAIARQYPGGTGQRRLESTAHLARKFAAILDVCRLRSHCVARDGGFVLDHRSIEMN